MTTSLPKHPQHYNSLSDLDRYLENITLSTKQRAEFYVLRHWFFIHKKEKKKFEITYECKGSNNEPSPDFLVKFAGETEHYIIEVVGLQENGFQRFIAKTVKPLLKTKLGAGYESLQSCTYLALNTIASGALRESLQLWFLLYGNPQRFQLAQNDTEDLLGTSSLYQRIFFERKKELLTNFINALNGTKTYEILAIEELSNTLCSQYQKLLSISNGDVDISVNPTLAMDITANEDMLKSCIVEKNFLGSVGITPWKYNLDQQISDLKEQCEGKFTKYDKRKISSLNGNKYILGISLFAHDRLSEQHTITKIKKNQIDAHSLEDLLTKVSECFFDQQIDKNSPFFWHRVYHVYLFSSALEKEFILFLQQHSNHIFSEICLSDAGNHYILKKDTNGWKLQGGGNM